VSEPRPARPLLATLICIFEAFTAIVPLPLALAYLFGYFHSADYYPSPLPRSAVSWLSSALAIAAAVTLWRMHRSASYLFAARFLLTLALFLQRLPHVLAMQALFQHRLNPAYPLEHNLATTFWILSSINLATIALDALFAFYAYRITSPKPQPPEPIPTP
jgi:hypothetical protein